MSIKALYQLPTHLTLIDHLSSPRRRLALISVSFMLACAALSHPAIAETANPPEVGVWIDDTGQGAVEIKKCGRTLCGYVSWLRDPMSKRGGPKRDIYNPNPKNRNKKICGLQVLGKLVAQADGSWDGGWIYDPKVGQAFDVAVRVLSKSKLEVHGYQSIKILGKTFQWTRADKPLPACDGNESAAAQ